MDGLVTMTAGQLADLVKVGPKGYIHGWIKAGAGDDGNARLRGHLSAAEDAHAAGLHSEGDARLAAASRAAKDPATRESVNAARGHLAADRLNLAASARDRKAAAGDMSDAELKAADKEFSRRAAALGKAGQVSKPHKAAKDEIARRKATAS